MWKNPLPTPLIVPTGDHPGAFGTQRKHDRHTGVDLYTPKGTLVTAVEAGKIVSIFPFTGPEADSPWWHPTWAVMVEGNSGVVLYGEVEPVKQFTGPGAWKQDYVKPGDPIGTVLTVLKKDKGKPMNMLHLELYESGIRDAVWWREGEQPEGLLDPTPYLLNVT